MVWCWREAGENVVSYFTGTRIVLLGEGIVLHGDSIVLHGEKVSYFTGTKA